MGFGGSPGECSRAGSIPSPAQSSGARAEPEGRARACASADKTQGELRAGRMPSLYSPNSGAPSSATAVRKSAPVLERGDCHGGFFISAAAEMD